MERGKINRVSVNRRIMVDGPLFFDTNSNYTKPCIDELRKSVSLDGFAIFNISGKFDKIKDNLLSCSLTILGFIFSTKQ
jgi:hypothetical protein